MDDAHPMTDDLLMNGAVPLVLPDGAIAQVLHFRDNQARVASPHPSPPGSTLVGHLPDLQHDRFELKVRSCKRDRSQTEPTFVVEGRLQNATRALKERLERVATPLKA